MDGVLVDSQLEELIARGALRAEGGLAEDQVQPNSLDLRIGPRAYRVRASFLPSRDAVRARIEGGLSLYEVDLRPGAILERNAIYLIPLRESLRLPPAVAGKANPKSSTGRLDVFCRAVTDHAPGYDEIAAGYAGEVFLEVVPRSFSVRLREGDRLSQLRLYEGDPVLS
ncbi:MAG: 2'-deoxycytidine 5'-triphosphate deaminase, partial [Candidatus Methylomirabilis sp.]|nr:2'-deoxycytidine 5'-triphosphate deaminase [Deltaproteobacteria bacterium]